MGLLLSIVTLANPPSSLLPAHGQSNAPLSTSRVILVALIPALITPLLAMMLNFSWLPALVADYLAVHFAIYGGIQLVLLWIIAALCVGAVPFMLADALMTAGGRAPFWHRKFLRTFSSPRSRLRSRLISAGCSS